MARKIGVVYELDYSCGHARQLTMPARASRAALESFKRIVKLTKQRECVMCATRHNRDR